MINYILALLGFKYDPYQHMGDFQRIDYGLDSKNPGEFEKIDIARKFKKQKQV